MSNWGDFKEAFIVTLFVLYWLASIGVGIFVLILFWRLVKAHELLAASLSKAAGSVDKIANRGDRLNSPDDLRNMLKQPRPDTGPENK